MSFPTRTRWNAEQGKPICPSYLIYRIPEAASEQFEPQSLARTPGLLPVLTDKRRKEPPLMCSVPTSPSQCQVTPVSLALQGFTVLCGQEVYSSLSLEISTQVTEQYPGFHRNWGLHPVCLPPVLSYWFLILGFQGRQVFISKILSFP